MVNLSDICAMGGRPLAVADTLWIEDQADGEEVWAGMQAAAEAYGVPVVGGHTSYGCYDRQLGVSVLGQAQHLLTSYDATPGQVLLMAVDLDGAYFKEYPFWNASTDASAERLQSLLPLMADVAEKGWATAAKDVSMGGLVGTLAMLLHTSDVGAEIRLETVPKPPDIAWQKWLVSFPSYSFLMTTTSEQVDEVQGLFHEHDVACAAVGTIQAEDGLRMALGEERVQLL
jgi:selenophosphate synthetase-related protein